MVRSTPNREFQSSGLVLSGLYAPGISLRAFFIITRHQKASRDLKLCFGNRLRPSPSQNPPNPDEILSGNHIWDNTCQVVIFGILGLRDFQPIVAHFWRSRDALGSLCEPRNVVFVSFCGLCIEESDPKLFKSSAEHPTSC